MIDNTCVPWKLMQILKNKRLFKSPEYNVCLEFLKNTSESPVANKLVFQTGVLQTLGEILIENFNSKKPVSQRQLEMRICFKILKIFVSYSFDKLSHEKMIPSKEVLEGIEYLIKEFQANEGEYREFKLADYFSLIANLLLNKAVRKMIENLKILDDLHFLLKTSNNLDEVALLTQVFYNALYKNQKILSFMQKESFSDDLFILDKVYVEKYRQVRDLGKNKKAAEKLRVIVENITSVKTIIFMDINK